MRVPALLLGTNGLLNALAASANVSVEPAAIPSAGGSCASRLRDGLILVWDRTDAATGWWAHLSRGSSELWRARCGESHFLPAGRSPHHEHSGSCFPTLAAFGGDAKLGRTGSARGIEIAKRGASGPCPAGRTFPEGFAPLFAFMS